MEQRLKKQKNRLLLRVTLILLAVWLTVSATYFVIRLRNEKNNIQNQTLSELSNAKNILSISELGTPYESSIYISSYNILYFKNIANTDYDTQMRVIDPGSNKVIADTANKITVRYSITDSYGTYPDDDGYISYTTVRSMMSDSQFDQLRQLLQSGDDTDVPYEVRCPEFLLDNEELIPLTLSVTSPDGVTAETFSLDASVSGNGKICRSKSTVIPADFFLHDAYNKDYISDMTAEQIEKSSETIPRGGTQYLFYTSEYYYLDAYIYNESTRAYESKPKLYLIQYVSKADLLERCGTELAGGISVIFGFFFIIGVILCVMIWRTIKIQIIQEQKRRDLTNALAHDIKTPLFVISGYAYSLKENIDESERELYLDRIIGQTEQIDSLVRKMLNLSKLESADMTLSRSDFDLCGLIREILAEYASLPDGRSVAFTSSGDNSVNADKELLRTALQNLIENAVKYSPPGSEIQIDVSGRSFSISNPSEPLSESDIKKIWQPYFRMDKSRHKKGNGLGLSIVKTIFDRHGIRYGMTMKDGRLVLSAEC